MIGRKTDGHFTRGVDRALSFLIVLSMISIGVLMIFTDEASAAATTVTLRYGADEVYGNGSHGGGWTTIKWVTHIDGEPIDLDEIPGVSRSYAYCVQPTIPSPDPGTYNVTVIDDDDTGKIAKMRKLIYYLPGSYGYSKLSYKRWFANSNVGASDYAVGHMALSWIHANYSDSITEVWDGTPAAIENKAKSIVGDLPNLPDPPETYEVFWVKVSGRQDVFGAFYATEYGAAKIIKTSAMSLDVDGKSTYSLAGAEYTLYEDEGCSTPAKDADGKPAVLVTKADGSTDELTIETGDYYVKETKAPKGYALDNRLRSISIENGKTTSLSVQDIPVHCLINVLLNKLDKENGKARAQGDADLSGAIYKFSYYDGYYANASAAEAAGTANATWYLKTDSAGKVSGKSPAVAEGYKSSPFYKDGDGKVIFLLGTYVIQEIKPSGGYLVNSEKIAVQIKDDGSGSAVVKTYNEDISSKEQIIRGGLSIAKVDNDIGEGIAQGDASLEGAEFTVFNKSKQAIVVGGKEIAKDEAALVIKTDPSGVARTSSNALPYGTYLVRETAAPRGYLPNNEWSKTFTIRTNGQIADLRGDPAKDAVIRAGVMIAKRDKELLSSEALGGASLNGIVMTIKNVSQHDVIVRADIGNSDRVDWTIQDSKEEMFESGAIKRVKPGEDVGKLIIAWNDEKKAYTAGTLSDDLPYGSYTIRESKTNESYQRTDKNEHRFEVREDGTIYSYDGGFEDALSFDNYVYRSDVQGTKIGEGDSRRFSYVPFKITSMTNGESHVVVADINGFFSTADRRTSDALNEDEDAENAYKLNPFDDLTNSSSIKFDDVAARADDILMGVWFGTGEQGNQAEYNPSYGALPYDSYIIEEMECEHNAGYEMQKFFFTVEDKSQKGMMDLETITNRYKGVPEIGTQAGVKGENRNVAPDLAITLVDSIKYSNLVKGETYTVVGRLIDKKTDEVVRDANGDEVIAETEFVAKKNEGKTEVIFVFDGSEMHDMDTVVYERLYDANGLLIASHEEKDNEDQTVTWSGTPPDEPAIPDNPETPSSTPEPTPSPKTGDRPGYMLLYPILAILTSLEALLLTQKRRNDRLN